MIYLHQYRKIQFKELYCCHMW